MKKSLAVLFLLLLVALALLVTFARTSPAKKTLPPHKAMYSEKLPSSRVACRLCPNRCVLAPGEFGLCKARKNIAGELYSMVYGRVSTQHLDPIEKKPFFHVLPGSQAYSIATTGCNLRCLFCQNWELSQNFPGAVPSREMTPEEVVEAALRSGARSIAFTYNEPTIAYEYVLDIARLAKSKGLKTLMVSNGFIQEEPLKELLPFIDAYKVDFKGFSERFYEELTGGELEPVLATMRTIHSSPTWLEVVTLLVPGQNDSPEEVRALARWVHENLGPGVPLHFSRFWPQYKLTNLPPTPDATIIRARQIAREEGLEFVYTGNIRYPEGETTYCPRSGEVAIERQGYFLVQNNLKDGACPDGEKIPGIWS